VASDHSDQKPYFATLLFLGLRPVYGGGDKAGLQKYSLSLEGTESIIHIHNGTPP
jgi:hypothetical protein